MKLVRREQNGKNGTVFHFQIMESEKDWLLAALKLYPLLDSSHHQISKSSDTEADQQLLEESMAEQRSDHKTKLDHFLRDAGRFAEDSPGLFRFTLSPDQAQWLLQVLNELRVGSWIKLGRPDLTLARQRPLNKQDSRHVMTMEISGYFQMALLEAFDAK